MKYAILWDYNFFRFFDNFFRFYEKYVILRFYEIYDNFFEILWVLYILWNFVIIFGDFRFYDIYDNFLKFMKFYKIYM